MADRKKVINDLNTAKLILCNPQMLTPEMCVKIGQAINTAIDLLKEQEPVEPKVIIDTWVCGNCGTRLERQSMVGDNILFTERFDYCPRCGREVKWE